MDETIESTEEMGQVEELSESSGIGMEEDNIEPGNVEITVENGTVEEGTETEQEVEDLEESLSEIEEEELLPEIEDIETEETLSLILEEVERMSDFLQVFLIGTFSIFVIYIIYRGIKPLFR